MGRFESSSFVAITVARCVTGSRWAGRVVGHGSRGLSLASRGDAEIPVRIGAAPLGGSMWAPSELQRRVVAVFMWQEPSKSMRPVPFMWYVDPWDPVWSK